MFCVGTAVCLHSLTARPELNGLRGTIVKAADATSGRLGVRVAETSGILSLKPANLVDVKAEAIAAVLCDQDLSLLVLAHLERWAQAGILSGVCKLWQRCIWSSPDLYRVIIVVASETQMPSPPRDASRARGLHRAYKYGARYFMEENALPMLPRQLGSIPDMAWVEKLFFEPVPETYESMAIEMIPGKERSVVQRKALRDLAAQRKLVSSFQTEAMISLTLPRLTTLLMPSTDHGYLPDDEQIRQTRRLEDWLSVHLSPSLEHLHTLDQEKSELIDFERLSGVSSLELPDFGGSPGGALSMVKGWDACRRAKVRAINAQLYQCRTLSEPTGGLAHVIEIIGLLPGLRRLHFQACLETDEIAILARAVADSSLEALYINMDSTELSISALNCFTVARSLKELVVVCDECDWHSEDPTVEHFDPEGVQLEVPTEFNVTESLHLALKTAAVPCAVLVCNCNELHSHQLDSLHRVLLPDTEEEWHRDSNARGLEHLPFLDFGGEQRRLRGVGDWTSSKVRGMHPPIALPDNVYDAALEGNEAAVEAWLDRGGHVDARLVEEPYGMLLLFAASSGRLPMVELLVRRGASINLQNSIGWSALMGAAFEGSVAVVRHLLQSGANPHLGNENGNTALSIARQRRHAKVISLLCGAGAGATGDSDPLSQLFARFPQHSAHVRF